MIEPSLLEAGTIVAGNRYRIGDAIAMMTLRSLVDAARPADRSAATWHSYNAELLNTLRAFQVERPSSWLPIAQGQELPGARTFDDVNLWMWNDLFRAEDVRLHMRIPEVNEEVAPETDVLLHLLLDVDYAPERRLHPQFYHIVVEMLRRRGRTVHLLVDPRSMRIAHHRRLIDELDVPVVSVPLERTIMLIGRTNLFIGGDTGLSHIAGCFPEVRQIALYDRSNRVRHIERIYDHLAPHRAMIATTLEELGLPEVAGRWREHLTYNAFPNKATVRGEERPRLNTILFDRGGTSDATIAWLAIQLDTP